MRISSHRRRKQQWNVPCMYWMRCGHFSNNWEFSSKKKAGGGKAKTKQGKYNLKIRIHHKLLESSIVRKKVKKSKSHLRERNRGLKHYRESNQDPSFPLCSPLFLLLFEIVKVIMLAILLDNEGRSYAVLSWHINRLILITLMTQNGYQPYKPRARWKRNICNKMNIIYPEHRIQGW